MPNGMTNSPVTDMSDGNSTNPIDAAAEITDAMMSSLADVVKTVISKPEEQAQTEKPSTELSEQVIDENEDSNQADIDTTVDDIVSEGEPAHRSGDHESALKSFNKAIALDPSNSMAWFNRGVLLDAQFTGGIPTASSVGINGVVTDLSLIGSLTGGKIETTHIMIVDPFSSLIATGIAEVFG